MPDLLELAGRVGQAMLALGTGLAVLAILGMLLMTRRVRRRAARLAATAASARAEMLAALEELEAGRRRGAELLVPWRRLGRWGRHPLVVATLRWYLRRRKS